MQPNIWRWLRNTIVLPVCAGHPNLANTTCAWKQNSGPLRTMRKECASLVPRSILASCRSPSRRSAKPERGRRVPLVCEHGDAHDLGNAISRHRVSITKPAGSLCYSAMATAPSRGAAFLAGSPLGRINRFTSHAPHLGEEGSLPAPCPTHPSRRPLSVRNCLGCALALPPERVAWPRAAGGMYARSAGPEIEFAEASIT
jgi:hypothetical protein